MKRRDDGLWQIMYKTFRLVLDQSGPLGILAPFGYVVNGLMPSVITLISARLFDSAYLYLNSGGDSCLIWKYLLFIALFFVVKTVLEIACSILINANIYERCTLYFKIRIMEKFSKLSLIDYEQQSVYNLCQRAKECVDREKLGAVFMVSSVIATNAIGVIAALFVVASYNVWLFPISLASVLPYLITRKLAGRDYYAMKEAHTALNRRCGYLWRLLTSADSEKELHLNDASALVLDQWSDLNQRVADDEYAQKRKEARYSLLSSLVQTLGLGISIVMAICLVLKQQLSVGELGACIIAFGGLQNCTSIFLSELAGIQEHVAFARDFFKFMDIKQEADLEKIAESPARILLKGVSFSYLSSSQRVLSDIDLEIQEGEHIALVGENGSGKSTLVKLLMGAYPPDSGEVLVQSGGKTYHNVQISENLSVVLQDFTRYYFSLRENVAISDVSRIHETAQIKRCLEELKGPAKALDDRVGVEFGGIEFSGGQWQKIAIARGIFRDRDIFVLDEPTSAVDPIAETEILNQFLQIMKGRTAIIISHRIGLCRYVDKIVVMKQGRIAEIGSHEELLARKGEYARMYDKQSLWYTDLARKDTQQP